LKRQTIKWENIFTSYTSDKRLITRIYRELKKLNFPKINDPMKKMGKCTEWSFYKGRTLNDQKK
jgi:hypothetical protein